MLPLPGVVTGRVRLAYVTVVEVGLVRGGRAESVGAIGECGQGGRQCGRGVGDVLGGSVAPVGDGEGVLVRRAIVRERGGEFVEGEKSERSVLCHIVGGN